MTLRFTSEGLYYEIESYVFGLLSMEGRHAKCQIEGYC
jgi:hypothetical protein